MVILACGSLYGKYESTCVVYYFHLKGIAEVYSVFVFVLDGKI